MNNKQLNKYCDEVLRILYKSGNERPLLFGVGEFRKEEDGVDDLFVKIKVSEEDAKTVIQALEGTYNFITTDAIKHTSYYDLEKKENIKSALYVIKITDAGKYFIQTSSFSKEAKWKSLNKWVPNIPNVLAITAVLISVVGCLLSFYWIRKEKKELVKEKETLSIMLKESEGKLQSRIDSLIKNNNNQVANSK
jgi:hypothetical protein